MSTFELLQKQFDGAFVVPLIDLDKTLKTSKRGLYQAHQDKTLPFVTRKIGVKVVVSLLDLARWIDDPYAKSLPVPTETCRKSLRGRPSKAEEKQAAKLGITVSELRKLKTSGVQQ